MKTEVTLKENLQHIDIKIQINCCVCNVLDIEKMLDRFLSDIRDKTSCTLLTGMECALERLDLKPERLVADDGKEHYFIPKLHRALENIKAKLPFQILHMVGPLSEIQKKGNRKLTSRHTKPSAPFAQNLSQKSRKKNLPNEEGFQPN